MTHALRFLVSVFVVAATVAACGSAASDAPAGGDVDAAAPTEAGSIVTTPGEGGTVAQGDAANGGDVSVPFDASRGDPEAGAQTYPPFGNPTYFKAASPAAGQYFGFAVALSGDGNRLAVGARGESALAGAVYVFAWSGTAWSPEATIKASNAEANDMFGTSVALSADGSRLAVGASGEDSAASGVNGDATNDSAPQSGAAYVFVRSGTTWTQEAYVKASNPGTAGLVGDGFGVSVSLSSDGTHLAVGANGESSSATGVNGNQADDSASQSGAVYVFARGGNTWAQEAYVKASNPTAFDHFGWAVALSGDASRLAVAAVDESSNAKGPNGNQSDHSASGAGAVYVFARSGTAWSQESYLKASNTASWNQFGQSIALSSDGSTLAVGASMESSSATGINGNGDQTAAPQSTSGAAYVFRRAGTTWSQEAYVKASNSWAGAYFGQSIALSADGNRLAVGTPGDDSGATGINGNQNDGSAQDSGAAYVFSRTGTTWSQDAYVKASNTDKTDGFGTAIALSSDGAHLAVGAALECSNATGVNGDQSNNTAFQNGAAYVY